ncbi:hypothetical protein K4F52_002464 [Lecanicillium sp. MT-2017a]|nr:hypothetical protein K4F52_002464 [Lecanicillium sp. MT-2017a]
MRAALAVALAAVGLTGAQTVQNYTSALDMTIDPNTVELKDRAMWCSDEQNVCGLLCNHNTSPNTCDVDTLKYECKCASNSSAPGLQYYGNSMPSHICFELFARCNTKYVGDADNQELCKTNIQALCGTADAGKASTGSGDDSSSSASPASSTAGPDATGGAGGDSDATSSTQSGFAAPTMAPGQGIAAAAAALGVFAYVV